MQASENLDWWSSILLGVLQGIGEFLPISSSGHLAAGQLLLGIDPESAGHSFNIALHAGTLLSVLWVYRRDLAQLAVGAIQPSVHPHARPTIAAVIVATLPLGFALAPWCSAMIEAAGQDARLIGACWLATAALLAFSHRRHPPEDELDKSPALTTALWIGMAQLCAVLPGISRSGATIAAALALGLGRARAARFSFLISIPAITGASAKTLLDLIQASEAGQSQVDPTLFLVGLAVSFVVGLLALRGLLSILDKRGLMPFVPYLVVVGIAAIVLSY